MIIVYNFKIISLQVELLYSEAANGGVLREKVFLKSARAFFDKVAAGTLLKKRLWQRCFPVNFVKFLRTLFLQNTSGRLLLYVYFSSILIYLTTNISHIKITFLRFEK